MRETSTMTADEWRALAEREMDGLLQLARHEIRYHEESGSFPEGYMTPEELVGETLIQLARNPCPADMAPRACLYGMIIKTGDALAKRRATIQAHEAASTEQALDDTPLVTDPFYDDDEEFYEWFQPDEVLKLEDVLSAAAPTPEDVVAFLDRQPGALERATRQAALLYYRLDFGLRDVCAILGRKPEQVGDMLQKARAALEASG